MYLYKYKELLEVINIIVIFSIPMISLIFYTISKDKSVLSEIIIYILVKEKVINHFIALIYFSFLKFFNINISLF